MQSLTWSLPFSRIQFLVESSGPARRRKKKREREKEKDARPTSITSIPFCLLFITNLLSIRSFSFRGHRERAGPERNIEGGWKKTEGECEDRSLPFFTNQRLEMRFDSDIFINLYIAAQRGEIFNRYLHETFMWILFLISFNVIKRRNVFAQVCKVYKIYILLISQAC